MKRSENVLTGFRKQGTILFLAMTLGMVSFMSISCKRDRGCTDPTAINYDPNARKDDGSCKHCGCTDPVATNYNPKAVCNDGSCTYAAKPVTATAWINSVDWNAATTVTWTLSEAGGMYMFNTSPSPVVLTAGKPYIFKIINPVGNAEKHYFTPDGPANFFTAIATRKVQTPDAEYKAPYFEAIELLVPTVADRTCDIYFVPVKAGKYNIVCTITGHQAGGMKTMVEIAGDPALQLDLEVDPAFNSVLARDARKSGSDPVWTTKIDTSVTIQEIPSYSFSPTALNLVKNQAYKIKVQQQAGNTSKHYYTAEEFYKTVVVRKVQDTHAEIKPYYLKAMELLVGTTYCEMFFVPTVTGAYPVKCTITGHEGLGMSGTIVVL